MAGKQILKPLIPKPLLNIRSSRVISELTMALDRLGAEAMTDLTYYPPQLPGTSYVRTYRLQASWHREYAHQQSGTLRTAVYSEGQIAPYNDDVQGPNQTRDMRRRNWRQYSYPIYKRWPAIEQQIRMIFGNPRMFT